MPRFFADVRITDGQVRITGGDAKHIHVLRKKPGDEIDVASGANVYACRIVSITKDEVVADLIGEAVNQSEPSVAVTLFQALPKAAKMELIIQKSVELGVHAIVPVVTERSLCAPGGNKPERWQKISESAAKQCGRGIIPAVHAPVGLVAAAEMLGRLDEGYAAWEQEHTQNASTVFARSCGGRVGILVGPEGGLAEAEVELLRCHGAVTFSLGARILRTETAGFAALICLMMQRGEL